MQSSCRHCPSVDYTRTAPADVQMQCAAMAAAIKRELFDEDAKNAHTHMGNNEDTADEEEDMDQDAERLNEEDAIGTTNGGGAAGKSTNSVVHPGLTDRSMSHVANHHAPAAGTPLECNNDASGVRSGSNYHVPCPLCQAPLEQRLFRQHLDRHYPRDSPVCPVIQCGRRFAHPNSVRNHMRLKHAVQWLKMKAMRSSGGPFLGGMPNHFN